MGYQFLSQLNPVLGMQIYSSNLNAAQQLATLGEMVLSNFLTIKKQELSDESSVDISLPFSETRCGTEKGRSNSTWCFCYIKDK